MRILTDNDLMPWGKYEDYRMRKVPAAYLHYLWINGKKHIYTCSVADYIRRNLSALKREYPNGIW